MKKGYMKKVTLAVSLVLIAAVLLAVAGCGGGSTTGSTGPTQGTTKVLKVGMILPATGPAAEKGKPGGDAVRDAMEYVNKELLKDAGYQISIDWRDSAYDAAKVGTIITEFMNSGDLLFTAMSSKEMTAAMEKANRAGFPGIATFASPNLYNPPQHIYGQMPDYGDDWVAFVKYYLENIWKKEGKPKMALHLLDNTTGSSVRDVAKVRAEELGVEIVAVEEHKATTISETESLTRIKSLNPDVIFISSTPQPTSVILKNARDLGLLASTTIGAAHASFTKALVDLAGADVVEGVIGVYPTATWDDDIPGIAKAKEYVMKNNPADYGNMDYLSCWATSLIVAEVIRTAVENSGLEAVEKGDKAAWKVIEESGIRKLNGYDVEDIQGAVSYSEGDNRLSKYVKIYTVKEGQITPITGWVEAW